MVKACQARVITDLDILIEPVPDVLTTKGTVTHLNPLAPDGRFTWPTGERDGVQTDMSEVPGPDRPRAILAYFEDFADETAWYAITNAELGFGVGLAWPTAAFPHAWFWQEMHSSAGFPWYKGVYVMAIEPFTSVPGQGLAAVMEKTGTHRTLDPGQTVEAELRAVFFDSRSGVERIDRDGTATPRQGGG